MEKEIERLNKQLAHLEKSYKAGIVKKSEFLKGKKKVEKKLKIAEEKVQDQENKSAAVKRIIDKPKSKKIENTPKVAVETVNVVNIKQEKKKERKVSDNDDERSSIWSYLLLLLVIVLILFFVYKYTETLAPTTDSVVVYDYSNFFCDHCSDLQETLKEIKKDYGVKVKIYHRQFPNDLINPLSTMAAEASECANDQNRFIEYHNILFENNERIDDKDDFIDLARDVDIEFIDQFEECLNSHEKLKEVMEDVQEGKDSGVEAIPTLVIDGEVLKGKQSYKVIASVIEKHLN